MAEDLSLKRAELEKTKLKSNFSIAQYFATDPERHRHERIATLEFEIATLEKNSKTLNDELVALESEIATNIQVIHEIENYDSIIEVGSFRVHPDALLQLQMRNRNYQRPCTSGYNLYIRIQFVYPNTICISNIGQLFENSAKTTIFLAYYQSRLKLKRNPSHPMSIVWNNI